MFNLRVFEGKTIFITGATGLIGRKIVNDLVRHNTYAPENPIRVIALVRDIKKAKAVFASDIFEQIEFVNCDVCALKPENKAVDYIIHGASQTSSKAFVNQPVETTLTAINGTLNLLEFAKQNPVKGFVYLSTMEVYGSPDTDEKIFEDHSTNLNTMKVRSCYPESKRMCENLCTSYVAEYGVPVRVARLTQTFGPGVQYNDGRVFAEFARCVIEHRNIVLNTKGETKRNYLYVDDAVNAIFTILVKGENGKAYNVANEDTYCSIYEMAKLVAEQCAKPPLMVVTNTPANIEQFGYAPTLKMNLATDELKKLGWSAKIGLLESFMAMIEAMQKEKSLNYDK
jgi:nucleoside-diphosphate-sugar epimerase